ncbi:MAG TPA: 2-phosphosulfolactate phosphatase family protein [Ignavibacteriales bacterium]|nr:2-phosphosulfolactate phosphatase family protein [Ignavibacteriales bacterium]
MNIDVIISADDIKPEKIKNKTVVVIDILRATSVIVTAVNNGCKKIIPVVTVEEAFELSKHDRSQYVLGGERGAVKIDGFDFSNSPLEFTPEVLKDKTLIMSTTNGTKAINGCLQAKSLLIGAIINAAAVAREITSLGDDAVLVNAGTEGQFSMDDFIAAGYIIHKALAIKNADLSDVAKTSLYIYENNPDLLSFIRHARHYKRIEKLGLEKDVLYCCRKNIIDIVPLYKNGIIS